MPNNAYIWIYVTESETNIWHLNANPAFQADIGPEFHQFKASTKVQQLSGDDRKKYWLAALPISGGTSAGSSASARDLIVA